jgi:hypothetical protein
VLTLAFDTATPRASCALVKDGELLGERESRAVAVLAAVDELLAESGLVPGDLDRIVCGVGPGSFTGIPRAAWRWPSICRWRASPLWRLWRRAQRACCP